MQSLNAIARGGLLPTKKLMELEKDRVYVVTNLKEVSTKYGVKIVAELDSQFQIFLPKKVSDTFQANESFYHNMQDEANKYGLFLTYHGGYVVEFSGK